MERSSEEPKSDDELGPSEQLLSFTVSYHDIISSEFAESTKVEPLPASEPSSPDESLEFSLNPTPSPSTTPDMLQPVHLTADVKQEPTVAPDELAGFARSGAAEVAPVAKRAKTTARADPVVFRGRQDDSLSLRLPHDDRDRDVIVFEWLLTLGQITHVSSAFPPDIGSGHAMIVYSSLRRDFKLELLNGHRNLRAIESRSAEQLEADARSQIELAQVFAIDQSEFTINPRLKKHVRYTTNLLNQPTGGKRTPMQLSLVITSRRTAKLHEPKSPFEILAIWRTVLHRDNFERRDPSKQTAYKPPFSFAAVEYTPRTSSWTHRRFQIKHPHYDCPIEPILRLHEAETPTTAKCTECGGLLEPGLLDHIGFRIWYAGRPIIP